MCDFDLLNFKSSLDSCDLRALGKDEMIKDAQDIFNQLYKNGVNSVSDLCKNDLIKLVNILEAIGNFDMNEHFVFLQYNTDEIIKSKDTDVLLKYISTPFGYLYEYSFCIKHEGGSSPITISNISNNSFIPSIEEARHNVVSMLLKRLETNDEYPKSIRLLKDYLSRPIQLSLF